MDEMLEAYTAAVRAKDVDAFVGLYADDVRTFDLWSEWSYDGKDALRGMVSEWFGSVGDDLIAVEFDEVRTQTGEVTWVLRKDDDGTWKIAHEHTSAPVGEGGKVQLRR